MGTENHFKFNCREERAVLIEVSIVLNILCIFLSKISVRMLAYIAKTAASQIL